MKPFVATLIFSAVVSTSAVQAAPPQAPAAPAASVPSAGLPACDGQIVSVYHEKIKEGGTLQGLMDAAKAQEAYWRAQGVTTNKIVVARIVNYDKTTKAPSIAPDEVYTYHFNVPPREQSHEAPNNSKPDYIEKYKANATIIEHKTLCMPKF
jgi:hypothetical protein